MPIMKRVSFIVFGVIILGCVIGWTNNWDTLGAMVPWRLSAERDISVTPLQERDISVTPLQERDILKAVEEKEIGTKKYKRFPDDIHSFSSGRNYSVYCEECAFVSSSGVMLNSNSGKKIDAHDCVIRMNNAPTIGFEEDVGTKTTIRVFSHTSVIDVKDMLKTHKSEINQTVFIAWGPERNMLPGRITHNHLKEVARIYPGIEIYVLSEKRVQKADDTFELETGMNRMKSGTFLSTGWFTMLLAKDVCQRIHVFGMIEDDYCMKLKLSSLPDVPYHYYKAGARQCETYNFHEKAPKGAHRFITEKRVFKKWAKEWGNVQFYNPEWDLG